MFPDPPADGQRTVFCRTCGKWRHPRHACARNPDHETAPLPVLKLRRDGPTVSDHFTGLGNPEMRRDHGVSRFDPTSHSEGTNSRFGATHAVYYLVDEHAPADVITEWIEANEGQLSGRGLTTENLTRALSAERFKDAWRDLRREEEFAVFERPDRTARGTSKTGNTRCPVCGERFDKLPSHLPCDEASDRE